MKRNYLAQLVLLAAVAVLAVAQPAPSAGQGTWSEHPPAGVDQGKQQKDDKGAADRDQIQKLVQQQLQSDPALSSVNAEVDNNDVVTLTGTVATKNDRDHAKQLAESVPGVRKVKDKIKIGVSTSGAHSEHYAANTQSDSANIAGSSAGNTQSQPGSNPMASGKEDQIQNAIQNQLVDSRVSVMESDNSIVLSGVVPSQDAKTQAGQIAQQYASGKRVDNELAVGSVSATNPSGQGNAAMRRQIEDALRSEATLSPTVAQNIAVNTINHNVVLSGTVPTQADKDKAQQVAQQSAGVMQVVNNIQVTSPLSNASSTETTVGVAGSASSVALSNSSTDTGASGNIGATGQSSTDSAGQSTTAEQDVPTGGATAAQSATDLKSQIENSLQKEQLTGVLVNVTDNTIELSGMVPNAKEKQTARRIAQSFAGTRKLVDHIRLTGEGQGPNAGSDTRSQRINQNPPGVRSTGDPNAPTTNPVPPHSSERGNASRGDLAGHPSSFVVPEKSALRGSRQQLFRSHAI